MKNLKKIFIFVLFAFMTVLAFGMKNVKAADQTITINYNDTFSPAFAEAVSDTLTAHSVNGFNFKEKGIYYKKGSYNYLMFGKNKGYLYNTESLGTIKSIAVTYSGGVSATAKIGVYFGSSEMSTYTTTSNATIGGKSATDVFTNEINGNGFFQISTSNSNCQITKIVIIYGDSINPNEPSVTVEGGGAYKIGATPVQLTAEVENVTGEVIWNSTNEEVVTVVDGLVSFVGMGTADVTATVGGVTSAALTYTVWPDNTNPISIETALAICEFTGKNYTSDAYTAIGTITNIDGNNLTLSDKTHSIIVYSSAMANAVSVNDKVAVTGSLIKYNGTTPEFGGNGVTYQSFYQVSFDSAGGSDVEGLVDVIGGTKIEKPEDPTKAGFRFYAWYNGEEVFDFETDTITANTTLTARWVSTALETALVELSTINAYMSMSYKYAYSGEAATDTLNYSFAGVNANTYTDWSDKQDQSAAIYAGQSSGGENKNIIQLRSKNNNSGIVTTTSGGKLASVSIVWDATLNTNESRRLQVYGSNTAYTSPTELYNNATAGTLLGEIAINETTLTIIGDYEYIGLRSADGAIYISSISIAWGNLEFTDVDFRLKVGVDKTLADIAADLELTTAQYGIEVFTNAKTVKYSAANELYAVEEDADGKAYVVIDLGDVLNNLSRVTEEFTVRAYVEVEGQTYYSSLTKTYSIKTLVDEYLPMNIEEVNEFKSTLEALGFNFN